MKEHAVVRLRQHSLAVLTAGWGLLAGCAVHPGGTCGPACSTIESATHIIEYPSQRLTILKHVAVRDGLSQHEQSYLVNAIFMGGYSDDVADALVNLIENPGCTPYTLQAIREKIKLTRMLGRAERRVIEALNKRTEAAATQPAR